MVVMLADCESVIYIFDYIIWADNMKKMFIFLQISKNMKSNPKKIWLQQ